MRRMGVSTSWKARRGKREKDGTGCVSERSEGRVRGMGCREGERER